jgi:molecular chaperone DnaK (HSP70)
LELTQEKFALITEQLFSRMASVLSRIGEEVFVEWAVPPQEAVAALLNSSNQQQKSVNSIPETTTSSPGDKWVPPPRKITKVALVGQITRLPSVRSFIQIITGVKPCASIDPGAAVALGAATHAGVLLGSVGSVELMDGSFVTELHARVTGFSEWQP